MWKTGACEQMAPFSEQAGTSAKTDEWYELNVAAHARSVERMAELKELVRAHLKATQGTAIASTTPQAMKAFATVPRLQIASSPAPED
jgi:hypothetical protein